MEGTRSPTMALAKSLGLEIAEAADQCEICDGAEGHIASWLGVDAHPTCRPLSWRQARAEHEHWLSLVADWHDRHRLTETQRRRAAEVQ